jgi:plastocyanin
MERRQFIGLAGLAASGVLAGCPASSGTDTEATTESTDTDQVTDTETETEEMASVSGPEPAVATELNAYRGRLYDAVALGRAGMTGAGASVAESIFARFEGASGEFGAHESLERTSKEAYEGFESALEELRGALEAGDVGAAADAADAGATRLQTAQRALAGPEATYALDLLTVAGRALNAGMLARGEAYEAAGVVAEEATVAFEDGIVYGELEAADGEAYESLEGALSELAAAASGSDAEAATEAARSALDAAVSGAYSLTGERVAGAAHIAAMQTRGWDAHAATTLGGPGTDYAHAAGLTIYRARAHDTGWLARRGATDTAGTMASDIFAHFEGARAHEALEEADGEAYEGFESGLASLSEAIESGNSEGIDEAIETVDSNLVSGIEALAGEAAPVLQAGFFRARFSDARELYRMDKNGQAATVVQDLFARFEANELGFHETLEGVSDSLYETFEEEHLAGLQAAYEAGDDGAVETHHQGVMDSLTTFEESYSATVASGSGASYMAALTFDAAAVDALGKSDRAATLGQNALAFFEAGAAGFHEKLEAVDEELYGTFEDDRLGAVVSAANNGSAVYPPVTAFNDSALEVLYTIAAAGGSSDIAPGIVSDTFASFENAAVHETLEEADTGAYEGFEAAMGDYQEALTEGDASPAGRFGDAATTAQFAVLGALDEAPAGDGGGMQEEAEETQLQGGPNVVEGVPDDADHVVEMQAVAFEPAELTVSVGDTVAFEHVGGEAHNVVAYEGEIPEAAEYWASGGFDSQEAAETGWENGEGAVQSGQAYVHTFETAGEHDYYCVPHEAAGMVGTIVVKE